MENDQITPLNYCAHAIEDIREQAEKLHGAAPKSVQVFRQIIDMLQRSVKFILPNCCDLIDPHELGQAHLDLTRIPYPCVAFEVPWEKEDGIVELCEIPQTPMTKRIALCWDSSSRYEPLIGLNKILDTFPDGGVFILPIYWGPEHKRWTVALGGSFVPYKNTVQDVKVEDLLPASRIVHTATNEAGLTKSNSKQFRAEPFYLLPEFYDQTLVAYGGDIDKAYVQIMLDSRDEVQTVVQACSVINCANVTTVEVSPAAALNKKRQKNGKQPFFSYKVLQLSDERKEAGKGGAGGHHASARMHLRRGHLRRLESKVVWVRPSMVNAGSSAGVVLKDYAVRVKGK